MVQPNPGAQTVTPLTGSEVVDVLGLQWQQTTTGAIAALASLETTSRVVTTISTVGAGALTAAAVVGGNIKRTGAQSGAAFTDTTGTAVAIIAALPSPIVGADWNIWYVNATDAVATIASGVGVTINSGITPTTNITVPANGYAMINATVASASTVTLTQIGSGAYEADSTDTTKVLGFKSSGQATATTAIIAATNQSNATYTLPPSTGVLAATSGSNLYVSDVYRGTALNIQNSVTPTLIPGLTATVAVGTYRIKGALYTTPAATGGVAISFVLATAVLSAANFIGTTLVAAASATTATTTTTSATNIVAVATIPLLCQIDGTFVVSTAGTFSLFGCQNTQVNSAATINAGSYMELTRIA